MLAGKKDDGDEMNKIRRSATGDAMFDMAPSQKMQPGSSKGHHLLGTGTTLTTRATTSKH